jgi:hypothetical protein
MSNYDDASLIMYPSGYKEDKIYSLKPTDGSGDLTFTRASTATRVNSDGLIEGVRTNLVTYSENMVTDKFPVQTAVTNNFTTAPNGTTTAAKLENTATASQLRTSITTFSLSTFSFYAKYESNQFVQAISSVDGDCFVNFDIQNGVIGIAGARALYPQIESVGSGWYRCSVYFNTTSVGSYRLYMVSGLTAAYATASVTVGSVYYTWGWQIETGDIATDYIPTTTTAVSVGMLAGVPRIDYTGGGCAKLLLEPQRTNLVIYSEEFDNAAWNKTSYPVTITANQTASPTGYVDADLITPTAALSRHAVGQTTISATSGVVYTISAFFKKAVSQYVVLTDGGDSDWHIVTADLDSGTITNQTNATGTITSYANGWYRVTCTFTRVSTSFINLYVGASNVSNATSLPSFNDVTLTAYAWGVMTEAASTYATSYIPTTTTAVTRVADTASKTGISSLIGQTEGTIYLEADIQKRNEADFYVALSAGLVLGDAIYLYQPSGGTLTILIRKTGNPSDGVINVTTSNWTAGLNKVAIAYTATTAEVFINGASKGLTSFVSLPTLSQLTLAARPDNPGVLVGSGGYSQALLFTTRLTNDQLATLTTL